ncbi:RTA1 like protein-domain-containing protein [Phaeosphaeriaceae sp. PMI808]|nr:RTA1 like protein-domain-containing protein [Phaeosphaeriaceae sp. PMI808]
MADNSIPAYVLWPYTPSIAGGVVAAIVFLVLTSLHTWRLIKNRTWFCTPFIVGGIFETIGYAARAAAHNDIVSKTPYIIQSILILVAPILFAASVYMILGRIILRTDSASYSILRATWVTKIFVTGDILCFFIQGGGAGLLVKASDLDGFKMGENIILGGLVLQILIFTFFVVVASIWHRRMNAVPTAAAAELPWKKYIRLLYAASVFITARNLCRVIEYAMGKQGYLLSHEWPLYVYDFLPMVLTLVVCTAWYDPNIKPERKLDIEIGTRR